MNDQSNIRQLVGLNMFGSAKNLYTATAAIPVDIGMANSAGASANFFTGQLDEIRISDIVLNNTQLLSPIIPEPSTVLLLVAGGVMIWQKKRHQ